MEGQEVKEINIRELILWTENPRDPIDPDSEGQKVIDRILQDKEGRWELQKLAKEMGSFYDYSELPTVAYHGSRPIVYDGNRRIALGKIKLGIITLLNNEGLGKIPGFPEIIPCNVCPKKTALEIVRRKHSESGSWRPLERDIFLHNHMKEEKSIFLLLDESTGLVGSNQHLNKRFVRDEVFTEENLKSMGFFIKDGKFLSVHSKSDAITILNDVSSKIKDKVVTTRKYRGDVFGALNPESKNIIEANKGKRKRPIQLKFNACNDSTLKRRTRRSKSNVLGLFGGPLYLSSGDVNDLYRDIDELYRFYQAKKRGLSDSFPAIIRMALRLICETGATDGDMDLNHYVRYYFKRAKSGFSSDQKTTLSSHNVSESTITQLLQIGAHNYSSAKNIEQTLAISIAVGGIINLSHGRSDK